MELILLRHGKAEPSNPLGDFARALLPKGHQQAARAARLLAAAEMLPDIVLTSPLSRARQTADSFCTTAAIAGPIIQSWITCGMHPETALTELTAFRDFKRVAIVGHEPDLSQLVQWILGTTGGSIDFKKATLALLRVTPPSRFGTLSFLIPSKLSHDATGSAGEEMRRS